MGCHTWFSVPLETDKEKIVEAAQKWLDKSDESDSFRQMYQYAIDNRLEGPVMELACYFLDGVRCYDWIIYEDVNDHAFRKYNESVGNKYKYKHEVPREISKYFECYSDEPRIGGYPEAIIRSYDEMVKAMREGLEYEDPRTGESIISHFRYDKDRRPMIMKGIKTFFDKHPDGIITFG